MTPLKILVIIGLIVIGGDLLSKGLTHATANGTLCRVTGAFLIICALLLNSLW